jgi:hypothetical protein
VGHRSREVPRAADNGIMSVADRPTNRPTDRPTEGWMLERGDLGPTFTAGRCLFSLARKVALDSLPT